MELIFSSPAACQLRKLDVRVQDKILQALAELAADPTASHPQVKPLVGANGHRCLRVGDYRVVYQLLTDRLVVWVVKLGHRSRIYD